MRTSAVLLALVAVQQAAATGSSAAPNWNEALSLPSCSGAANQCTDQQKQGLDLTIANIPEGACGSYAGFDLQGLSYGSFGGKGKRDLFMRTGGSSSKSLSGTISKTSGPSISCGGSIPNKKASITNFHVSVDKDTDVLFTHSYEGSDKTCSYVKSCSASTVNPIDNKQCGQSTSVKCSLPPSSPHKSCSIGIHSVGFDCTPGQQQSSVSPPKHEKTSSPPQSNSPPHSPPQGTAPPISPPKSSSPPQSVPYFPPVQNSTAPAGTAPAPSVPAPSVPTSAPAESMPATTTAPTTPLTEVATTVPVQMSTVEQVTSEIVYTTVTSCPVSKTLTQGGSTAISVVTELSTVKVTSTMTICTKCVAPPQKTGSIAPPPPAASSAPAESQVASTVPAGPSSAAPATSSAAPAPSSAVPAPSAPSSAAPAPSAPSSAAPAQISAPAESQVASTVPVASSASPAQSSAPTESLVASSAPPAPPAVPQTTQAVVTTEIVYTTLTTCPVTNTVTPPHGTPTLQVTTTISTIISTTTSTICTQCIAPQKSAAPPAAPPASSAPFVSPTASSAPAVPSQVPTTVAPPAQVATSSTPAAIPNVPTVLPSCLQTWVTVTKCKDNSDYDCFCQHDSFTQSVYECISAWESDNAQQQAAMSLYAGICAQHVPAHPAIVTAVPSTITLVPTPASTPSSPAVPAGSAPIIPGSPAVQGAPAAVPIVGSPAPAANSPAPTAGPVVPGSPAAPGAPSATPTGSAPAVPAAAPQGTAPPQAAAAQLPPTTISISTIITLPCPSGAAVRQITDGQVQAATSMAGGCTTTSLLQTAVTVPQVALQTGASSSVGLVAGTPAPAQAAATGVPGVAGASSSAAIASPTGSTTPFTGAASKSSVSMVFVAAVAGLFVFA